VYDVSMDLDIQNIAWGDPDCGTLIVSGVPVAYGPGYLNVNHIKIKNLYITMATTKRVVRPVIWRSSHLPRSPALSARIASSSCCANPLTLDVVTQGNNPRESALADGGNTEKGALARALGGNAGTSGKAREPKDKTSRGQDRK